MLQERVREPDYLLLHMYNTIPTIFCQRIKDNCNTENKINLTRKNLHEVQLAYNQGRLKGLCHGF